MEVIREPDVSLSDFFTFFAHIAQNWHVEIFFQSLIDWLIDWFIDWFIDWLIDQVSINWLIDWSSVDWLIDWLYWSSVIYFSVVL